MNVAVGLLAYRLNNLERGLAAISSGAQPGAAADTADLVARIGEIEKQVAQQNIEMKKIQDTQVKLGQQVQLASDNLKTFMLKHDEFVAAYFSEQARLAELTEAKKQSDGAAAQATVVVVAGETAAAAAVTEDAAKEEGEEVEVFVPEPVGVLVLEESGDRVEETLAEDERVEVAVLFGVEDDVPLFDTDTDGVVVRLEADDLLGRGDAEEERVTIELAEGRLDEI